MPTPAVADPATWYAARQLSDGITLIWERHVGPGVRCNIWHVRGRDRDLLIDTGLGMLPLRAHLPLLTERPLLAIATHSHFDHSGGLHEFEHRAIHAAEADIIADPTPHTTVLENWLFPDEFAALPPGVSLDSYAVKAAPATQVLTEGDVIDLGDRVFHVLHVPGHSPGSAAFWEPATGILFTGDALYDGELLDELYHSDVPTFLQTMERFRTIPVQTVHGGHYASFGRDRFLELIEDYVAGKRAQGCPHETAPVR